MATDSDKKVGWSSGQWSAMSIMYLVSTRACVTIILAVHG
jgi:hypothetical protein